MGKQSRAEIQVSQRNGFDQHTPVTHIAVRTTVNNSQESLGVFRVRDLLLKSVGVE